MLHGLVQLQGPHRSSPRGCLKQILYHTKHTSNHLRASKQAIMKEFTSLCLVTHGHDRCSVQS